MNTTFAITFLMAIGLIILILKSSKKKTASLMKTLSNVSKLIIFENFLAYYEQKLKLDDKNLLGTYAAAATNYLFSEKPADNHKTLNIKEIEIDAVDFVKQNKSTRELLVQSLRVTHTLNIQKNKNIGLDSIKILTMLGEEFPESPRVNSYFILIHRELNKLPESTKSDIMNTFPNALNYYQTKS
jgi:hypothetical protein